MCRYWNTVRNPVYDIQFLTNKLPIFWYVTNYAENSICSNVVKQLAHMLLRDHATDPTADHFLLNSTTDDLYKLNVYQHTA